MGIFSRRKNKYEEPPEDSLPEPIPELPSEEDAKEDLMAEETDQEKPEEEKAN